MADELNETLRQANTLLWSGQTDQARRLLMGYVRQNPNSEEGWYLLSQAMSEPKTQLDCLRQVLRINPSNIHARRAYEQLTGKKLPPLAAAPAQAQPPTAAPAAAAEQPALPPATPVFLSEAEALAAPGVQPPSAAEAPGAPAAAEPPAKPTARKSAAKKPAAKKKRWVMPVVGCLVAILVLSAIGAGIAVLATSLALPAVVAQVTFEPVASASPTLPPTPRPTRTPTPQPSITPTPTITLTPAPSPTATFAPPVAPWLTEMARIEQEVSDVRGLAVISQPPKYLITKNQAQELLTGELDEADIQQLKDDVLVYNLLGLVKPTYDLVNYTLNGIVDSLGGFYMSDRDEVYVLGYAFRGLEHYIYAHEFGHALVDQHYNLDSMGLYPTCQGSYDRCEAVRALIEGDASLAMNLWLEEYATPQDVMDILSFNPPSLALPEQNPPPFLTEAVNFPYQYGEIFVNTLHKQGNWAAVNEAFQRLPESTEQILHPEKYSAGEAPLQVLDPLLASVLPAPWRSSGDNSLGEWGTYLVLAYSDDLPAQRPQDQARQAAEGWGGDHYQVYTNDESGQSVLAAHWAWDSAADAAQFQSVIEDYLDQRFRGARLERPAGSCWEVNDQATCFFTLESESLWLIAPDQATLDLLMTLFPAFTQ
jgi:hypothetical protein